MLLPSAFELPIGCFPHDQAVTHNWFDRSNGGGVFQSGGSSSSCQNTMMSMLSPGDKLSKARLVNVGNTDSCMPVADT